MYEIAQGEQSPWYGYLQALPDQGEDLPIFWEEEEKELFNGTEMESAVRNDLVRNILSTPNPFFLTAIRLTRNYLYLG